MSQTRRRRKLPADRLVWCAGTTELRDELGRSYWCDFKGYRTAPRAEDPCPRCGGTVHSADRRPRARG